MSRGRCTTTPSTSGLRPRWATMTSIGSVSGRGIPHRRAADRCDAMVFGVVARTAAAIVCSGVRGKAATVATPRCTRINPDRP